MSQYTVPGDSPVQIITVNNQRGFGQNISDNNIYLSELQDVSPNNYSIMVDPNGTFQWPAGKQLFAIADPLLTATVTYITNGAAATSGTTGISSPISLASSVKPIPGEISGNPYLYIFVPKLTTGPRVITDSFITTGYSSLLITCFITPKSGAIPALDSGNYIEITITQTLGDSGNSYTQSHAEWLFGVSSPTSFLPQPGPVYQYQVPVVGSHTTITVRSYLQHSVTADWDIYFYISGSGQVLTESNYTNITPTGLTHGLTGIGGMTYAVQSGGSGTLYHISSQNKSYIMGLSNLGGSLPVTLYMLCYQRGATVYLQDITDEVAAPVKLPALPCSLLFSATGQWQAYLT